MSENLKELNAETFAEQIKSGVTLVDFWAPWCGPCRMQTPILEQLAPRVAGKAVIAKLNVDEAPETAAQYGIRSIPTLILFKDGRVVQQFVGVQQATKLEAAIQSAL